MTTRDDLTDLLKPVIEKAITEQAPVWDHKFPEDNYGLIVGVPDAVIVAAHAVVDAGWRPAVVELDNTGPDLSDPADRRVPYREPGAEVQAVRTFDGGIYRRESPDGYGGRWIREGCTDPTVWNDGWLTWETLWKEKWPERVE